MKPLNLKDRKGNMIVLAPVLCLVLMTFSASLLEHSRLNGIAGNTRDAVQAAITQVCADNSKNVYSGVREGYAGGYKFVDAGWKPEVTSGDIMAKVDAKLGTANGVKTADGKTVFRISNLSVTVRNPPLAPTGTEDGLTGEATYTLTVPLSFGWSSLPPMVIQVNASSAYSPQGPERGNAGQPDPGQPVTRISLSETDMTLDRGDTEVLSVSVTPEDADNHVSWTSTDSKVCTVTQTGAVTGVDRGTASVVALSSEGKMAACRVTVVNPVTGVVLDKSSMTMIPGATANLHADVLPGDATNRGVQWASSDSKICTVDSSGKVTAVEAGMAKVTVMTQEGGFFADCVVTVKTPASGLTLDKTSLTMKKGDTEQLTATVYPSGARPDVLWASSDGSVCTVDQTGKITAVGDGSAVISATTKDLRHTATCNVTVSSAPGPVKNLKATMSSSGWMTISWSCPDSLSAILSYTVRVGDKTLTVTSESASLSYPYAGDVAISVCANSREGAGAATAQDYVIESHTSTTSHTVYQYEELRSYYVGDSHHNEHSYFSSSDPSLAHGERIIYNYINSDGDRCSEHDYVYRRGSSTVSNSTTVYEMHLLQ